MATMGNKQAKDALEVAKTKIQACNSPGEFRELYIRGIQDKDKALVSAALVVLDKILEYSPMTEEEEEARKQLNKMVTILKTIKAPEALIDKKIEDGLMTFVGAINRMESFSYIRDGN